MMPPGRDARVHGLYQGCTACINAFSSSNSAVFMRFFSHFLLEKALDIALFK
jgi:hypothetical protein